MYSHFLRVDKFTYDEWQSEGFEGQNGDYFCGTDGNDKLNARRVPGSPYDEMCEMSEPSQDLLITKYDCV